MRRAEISLPELGLIAGTRGILGAGLALLVGDRLSETQRKSVGWALFLVGALSTIPLVMDVLGKRLPVHRASDAERSHRNSVHRNRAARSRM